ncbi:DUF2716 domain-containing protein [Kibdelosporangium aridum]|uniref:DUF2716 domain-containing protein n=1 Tax=Kibdelosporangium aridum TaxID=2030 RepID=A0A428ZR35_KIBAR|nr:DUF2716 domain-containing protein [Kibdelosporangium aridum]RSM90443.1 DUF2716 domain-containing protein [Kibdelosporangium aridum]
MEQFAWAELEVDLRREVWLEFVAEFDFDAKAMPAFTEPVPSITWSLPRDGPIPLKPVAQLVCDVLRECVEYWDSMFHHDVWHPSAQYRPHRVVDVEDLEGWEYSHYPYRDFSIFVSKDMTFGVVGNPLEDTICFFGAPPVSAVTRLNNGVLTQILRCDGTFVGMPR